jgi:hypothetical protein
MTFSLWVVDMRGRGREYVVWGGGGEGEGGDIEGLVLKM